MSEGKFTWVEAYKRLADAVAAREGKRDELLASFAKMTGADDRDDIDPFTFFTAFNRGAVAADRRAMISGIIDDFQLNIDVPVDFVGIPTANHELWQYFDDSAQGIADCWRLFDMALEYADDPDSFDRDKKHEFGDIFDTVHAQENITKANLTRALYWIRPDAYLPLGAKTRDFIHVRFGLNPPYTLSGLQYFRLVKECGVVADDPFYVITAKAYRDAHADSWWPPQSVFDPGITQAQWGEFLLDPDITDDAAMKSMVRMANFGGAATGEELAKRYGKDSDYYVSALKEFAQKVGAKVGISGFKGSQWPIAFVGQDGGDIHKGDYVYKMRPELYRAIMAIGQ